MTHRAWLVDLDGTLYTPLPVKLAMAAELALFGWGQIAILRAFRGRHEDVRGADLGDSSDPFQLQLRLAAEDLGCDSAAVERVVRDWMVRRPGKWLARFRRRELLREIEAFRSSGGKTALVSDYPARDKLRALGAELLFDVVIASGEPGGPAQLKPAPDGYLAAARALDVPPGECLVIGDREDADGEAARRAEMAFRRVPRT